MADDPSAVAPAMSALDDVMRALDDHGSAVLVAPPGTGKTTELPPALAARSGRGGRPLDPGTDGRIVVVVPRRMAVRAAAARMAARNGEAVGQRFGYSVRHDRRAGRATVVEVVTPGLLLRRLQADPALAGTSTVVLDEFHERSLDTDLLLALLIEVRSALRPELRVLVMSATLDAAPVAKLLGDAPVVSVESPLFPIRTLHRPGSAHDRLADRVAEVVGEALAAEHGDLLVFLPGRGEIRSTARVLAGRIGNRLEVCELHGSVPPERVDEILSPDTTADRLRRVILATSVAETSITVPGVHVVVDSGLRRSAEVDRRTGLPGLVTRSVSIAGADQRRGRCGREGPGTCYRMWAAREEETRRPTDPPEIEVADLCALRLSLMDWGARPDELAWLDRPPQPALERAADLLEQLGAGRDRPTPKGRDLARLGFHPRIGAIALEGAALPGGGGTELAAEVAAVLESDGAGHDDICEAVRKLRSGDASRALKSSLRQWRRQLTGNGKPGRGPGPPGYEPAAGGGNIERRIGRLVLAGYADRLARRRSGRDGIYHLRGGGEVELRGRGTHGEWMVVVALDARPGSGRPGLLHLGADVHPDDVADLVADERSRGSLGTRRRVRWDPAAGSVHTDSEERLGAIVVGSSSSRGADEAELEAVVADTLGRSGPSVLPGWPDTAVLRQRIAFAAAAGLEAPSGSWPELGTEAVASSPQWLAQRLVASSTSPGHTSLRCDGPSLHTVFDAALSYEDRRLLDTEVPKRWRSPSGRELRLDYGSVDGDPASVALSCRLQDLLGVDVHPTVGRTRVPVSVELLSPAGRPLQRTLDLPGFWRGTYAQVRAEMRGRYPKHRWPQHPWEPDSR